MAYRFNHVSNANEYKLANFNIALNWKIFTTRKTKKCSEFTAIEYHQPPSMCIIFLIIKITWNGDFNGNIEGTFYNKSAKIEQSTRQFLVSKSKFLKSNSQKLFKESIRLLIVKFELKPDCYR